MLPNSAVDLAWKEYSEELDQVRGALLQHPFAATSEGRNGALYLFHQVQAVAFNIAIATRQESPRFYSHSIFEPTSYTWTSPGSDYLYRKAFVRGDLTYRIWGRRSNSKKIFLQAMGAYWNDVPSEHIDLGCYDFDELDIDNNGNFEIIASAEPVSHGNWIKLDKSKKNICLMVREIFEDWDSETCSELHIELLDSVVPFEPLSEGVLADRILGAIRFVKFVVSEWSQSLVERAIFIAGYNSFSDAELEKNYSSSVGINPLGGFHIGAFDISDDHCLILELDVKDAVYWGIQTSDLWHQNSNYLDCQSSLNSSQSKVDSDGVYRFVVAKEDPGVLNWLDTVGVLKGGLDLRLIGITSPPKICCSLVKSENVKDVLPKDTLFVSPGQRRELLAKRRRAGLARWGY